MALPEEKYIVVNYHYVRDPDPDWTGIHSCSVAEFERQIKFLSEHFMIVSIPKVVEAAQKKLPEKFCAITFDDGLSDNYHNVLPILKKYGVSGTFFIITSAIEGRTPLTHKLHALFSRIPAEELIDIFNQQFIGKYNISKDCPLDSRRVHGDVPTNNFKETMMAISNNDQKEFLDFCFKKFNLDEARLNKDLFMTTEQIKDLKKRGMEIGSHSDSHNSFEIMGAPEAETDVIKSRKILEELFGKTITLFSYPHGRYSAAMPQILQKCGFQYAVTIDRRPVSDVDNDFLLPRYDANDLSRSL